MFRLFTRYILPLLVSAGVVGTGVNSGLLAKLKNSLEHAQVTIVEVSRQTETPTATVTPTPEQTQVATGTATVTPTQPPTVTSDSNQKDNDSDMDNAEEKNENSSEEAREALEKNGKSEETNESRSEEDRETRLNDEKTPEETEVPVDNIQGNEGAGQAQTPIIVVLFDQFGHNLNSFFSNGAHGLHLGNRGK